MSIYTLIEFFKYCTIINSTLLLISFFMIRATLAYNLHAKLGFWEGTRESHRQLGYTLLGIYKILIIVFNVVPYFTLCCFV